MELTRVTRGGAEKATRVAATGGDADLLALVLGGDQVTGTFPATLEAALTGGDVGEEPIAVDGEATGDGGESNDAGGGTVDLAVAAALALGAALAGSAVGDDVAAGAEVSATGVVDADAAAGVAADATAAVLDGGATSTTDAAGTTPLVSDASATTEGALADAAAAKTASADAAAVVAAEARTTKAERAAAASAESDAAKVQTTSDAAPAGGDATQADAATVRAAKRGAQHSDGAATQHGAGAGVESERIASFSSGADEKHGGLDLGTSDRHRTATTEKPAASAAAPVGSLAALDPLAPAPHAGPGDATTNGVTNGVTTTATASSPTATHDTSAARGDRPGQPHPGGIEPRWGERVAEAMRLSAARGGGEIRLQLEPEGLGHIDVRLHLQGDGVRAVIVAEHESTRALLTSQQQVLHDALQRSDVRLSGFTVDVGSGNGGTASFAQPDAGDGGNERSAAPSTSRPAGASGDGESADATPLPLANGRVSVRV